jgi:hypothetical protein
MIDRGVDTQWRYFHQVRQVPIESVMDLLAQSLGQHKGECGVSPFLRLMRAKHLEGVDKRERVRRAAQALCVGQDQCALATGLRVDVSHADLRGESRQLRTAEQEGKVLGSIDKARAHFPKQTQR